MTGVLTLDKGMTLEDCDFLTSVYVPSEENLYLLNLAGSLSTEEIQDFAIAFKLLDGKKIYNIVSLHNSEHSFPLFLFHDPAGIHCDY